MSEPAGFANADMGVGECRIKRGCEDDRNVRVMLSIGGITYVTAWNQALAADPVQLGLNAAQAASQLGVGIEIDYEENRNPNLAGLEAFINAYRSQHPYDATGTNPAARLRLTWLPAIAG